MRKLCDPLPFSLEMPKVSNVKTEDLTTEQLKNLLDAIEKSDDIHAANLMKLALFTGLRRGEMLKLKWSDINFERGFIHIRDPKGGPDQMIPLNSAASGLLECMERNSEFVFPGPI